MNINFTKYFRTIVDLTLSFLIFSSTSNATITIIPSDYIVTGSVGDTWRYKHLDDTQFSWTLTKVVDGPNAGLFERGNNTSGLIYDLKNKVLSIHELDKVSIPPSVGFVLSEIELGQIITLNDDINNPTMFLFWRVPSVSVIAGVYHDVIAFVWLDNSSPPHPSNTVNTELNLPSSIITAVTDVDYYVRGIGQVHIPVKKYFKNKECYIEKP